MYKTCLLYKKLAQGTTKFIKQWQQHMMNHENVILVHTYICGKLTINAHFMIQKMLT